MSAVTVRPELIALLEDSREAARVLANVSTAQKNAGLAAMADAIEANIPAIVAETQKTSRTVGPTESVTDCSIDFFSTRRDFARLPPPFDKSSC
jgi:gamma-glutamyl phosphate reductase